MRGRFPFNIAASAPVLFHACASDAEERLSAKHQSRQKYVRPWPVGVGETSWKVMFVLSGI